MEESTLRKRVRKAMTKLDFANLEESIDLILTQLEITNRLQRSQIVGINQNKLSLIRIAEIGETFDSSEIPTTLKAPYQIKESIRLLSQHIEVKQAQIKELNSQIKDLGKSNQRE